MDWGRPESRAVGTSDKPNIAVVLKSAYERFSRTPEATIFFEFINRRLVLRATLSAVRNGSFPETAVIKTHSSKKRHVYNDLN